MSEHRFAVTKTHSGVVVSIDSAGCPRPGFAPLIRSDRAAAQEVAGAVQRHAMLDQAHGEVMATFDLRAARGLRTRGPESRGCLACVMPWNNMPRTLAGDVFLTGVSESDEINVAR